MFLNVYTEENPPRYRCDIQDPKGFKYILQFDISNPDLCNCDGNCNMSCCPYGYYPIPPEDFVLEIFAIISDTKEHDKDSMKFRIDDESSTVRFYTNDEELAIMLKMTWDPDHLKHLYDIQDGF